MIGTYYRLSLADEDVGADKAESNSIQGQRGLVEGYIMAHPELAAEPRQEYVDDGYSGTSTSRPAFQRLIQDAQDGKVKTIIVKDFSRFARDYIEAGDYMERIFPLLGVRFISVNDGYDSGMQAGNDVRGLEVAIKNIINASYSRDLSAKIAAADHVMQKKGMYLGGYRPFGFLPDPNDCHKLILDPVASQYVRLIFELALQGNRTGTIAKILNEKQIPTPAAYHVAENHVYSEQKAWDLQRSHWTSGTVYHVLKNEKYKGTYVGAKFIMPVPCKHRVLRAPLEQQVRIEDSHAAIVTPEEFEQAQMVIMLQNGNHQSGNYTKHQYPLKGKVYCGYCQKLMKYRVLKKLGPSFNCRFSATAVDSPCKRVPIAEELLEHIVRNALAAQIKQAEYVLEILHERERKALICFSALERQEEKLSAEKAAVSIKYGVMKFNMACIRLFEGIKYVLPILHPNKKRLALIMCPEEDSASVEWARQKDENWVNKDITSLEFVENIFKLMNWNRECRYKVLGRVANSDQGLCMLFDLEEAIMFTPKPQEYTDPLTGEMKKKQMKFFPDAYKNRIGKSYNDYIADHQMNMFEDFIGYQSSTVLDEPEREAGTTSIPIPQREESENIPSPDLPEQLENVQQSGNEIAERGMQT